YMSLAPRPRHRQSHRQAARPGILITWTSSKGGAPEPRAGVLSHQQDGAHYWARVLMDLGHDVRLISPQFVTPYVKSNKNDRNDAEAICEAVGRPSMRFVPPKTAEQLEIQAVHRIRQRLVSDRTRFANQICGLLAEHGTVMGRDISRLRRGLGQIANGASGRLGEVLRDLEQMCIRNWPTSISASPCMTDGL
ncbi:IS110 family transposase, partial [Albidovulum sediminicola]|uniref:IS110 family transposase n=1 Tax=Albidovulum sediminicola TaxID=2984331 RepID=UPI0039963A94